MSRRGIGRIARTAQDAAEVIRRRIFFGASFLKFARRGILRAWPIILIMMITGTRLTLRAWITPYEKRKGK
jgi:hypothetical protein